MRNGDSLEPLLRLTLDALDREFPVKPSHVYGDAESIRRPRDLTPAFFGCFDWHSAVHGHWTLVRALRCFAPLSLEHEIRERLDTHLTARNLSHEQAFFARPENRHFERPYGWGWLLLLHAELSTWDDVDGVRWARAVEPLADLLASQLVDYLNALPSPIRSGTHGNTAFSLVNALDAARATSRQSLEQAIVHRARTLFSADRQYPVGWEPSGEDFVSPALAEADLMRRVLHRTELLEWLERFMPPPDAPDFEALRTPPRPSDPTDPRIGHLIGLCFHRAWCFDGLSALLGADDARASVYADLSKQHLEAGLDQIFDSGYGGSHWLATFAVYAFTGKVLALRSEHLGN